MKEPLRDWPRSTVTRASPDRPALRLLLVAPWLPCRAQPAEDRLSPGADLGPNSAVILQGNASRH